jgi:hypothetical protein
VTQPYGQQPYPSGGYPQQGTPPGGYPQAPGVYSSMPQAREYTPSPIPRPGSVTAAAVLAYVQAGITTITTIILLALLSSGDFGGGAMAVGVLLVVAQTAGVALLVIGGVQLASGKSRILLIAGCALELAICLYYLYSFLVTPTTALVEQGLDPARGVFYLLILAVMPTISWIMSLGTNTMRFLQSRVR